jgi:thiol-disulfide isomerase/thioredoxin
MQKKNIYILFLIIGCLSESYSKATIHVQADGHSTIKVSYPLGEFANDHFEDELKSFAPGRFTFEIPVIQPIFIRLAVANRRIFLLCEDNDLINIVVTAWGENGLQITGNNAAAHEYYNLNPIVNFDSITEVFEHNLKEEAKPLAEKMLGKIAGQTRWVDSIANKKLISADYASMMKLQIRTALVWHVGMLCDKYNNSQSPLKPKLFEFQDIIYKNLNPLDPGIKRCASNIALYTNYYTYLGQSKQPKIDTAQVIISESPFYVLAPLDIQNLMWGFSLFANKLITPTAFDYCKLFRKYQLKFPDGVLISFLERDMKICEAPTPNSYHLITNNDVDLFTFYRINYPGKRVFIDLWATWCGPCKMEFSAYDSAFYQFMEEHSIKLVYLSLDEMKNKKRWEKDLEQFHLKGDHLIAGPQLEASIKEVIFDQGPIVIPRYVLIDEQGNFLSVNFTRPSNATFKAAIEKYFPRK